MSASIPGLPPCPPPVPLHSPPPSAPSSSSSTAPPPPPSPKRKIFIAPDLAVWPTSEAYALVTQTILRLVYAVRGKSTGEKVEEGEAVKRLVRFLQDAKSWIAEVPLDGGPQRFGNKAFRVWVKRVEEAEPSLRSDLISLSPLPAATTAPLASELSFHLLSSLGSTQRLDYGTGHELSFLSFLSLLLRAGVFSAEREGEEQALVTRVFAEYLEMVREAQRVFRLEPAGSKGVWGLDDFQHLSYLFGASQLIDHPTLRPSSIPTPPSPALSASNLFSSSLTHTHTLKRGPFHEHSPLLHQISTTVPTWSKVTKGLWEMYKVEVLGKLPVVQHVRFGEGLAWRNAKTGEPLPSTGDGRDDEDDVVEGEEAGLGGPVITSAPWASSSSSTPPSGSVRPLPLSTRLPSSNATTTSSFSAASSSSSSHASTAFSRRQYPSTFPLPPHSSTTAPRSFAPPTLFPPRRTTVSAARAAGGETKDATTLAQQGGAAVADSPFGVLPKASLAGRAKEGGGVGAGGGGEGV